MKKTLRRLLSMALALTLVLSLLPPSVLAAPVVYTLDIADLEDVPQYEKQDGDTLRCGTDDYFTIFFSEKARIEPNEKNFSDGFGGDTKRLNFGGSTKIEDPILNAVQIKTSGPAKVKIWWVSGGKGRDVAIYAPDGSVVSTAPVEGGSVKNDLYITELPIGAAGTYYIGNTGGNNNYYKLEVTEENAPVQGGRTPWDQVAAPEILTAADDGKGGISVTVSAPVGANGGDEVVVIMLDAAGREINRRSSVLERDTHTILFTPAGSGQYTFRAYLAREGESDKMAAQSVQASFVLPLEAPRLISGTSKGSGSVELTWTAVLEAESYELSVDGRVAATTDKTSYTLTGLQVGQKYAFLVTAIRGSDRTTSGTLEVTVTQEEKVTWGFTFYGPSTNEEMNGYEGDVNEDGEVTVYSEGGKGKIVPGSVDGLAFYYTAVPAEYNFTLRAKVTVDSWTYSNGQEGFGLLVTDRLGISGDSTNFWNNQYMAVATKIEYRYDADNEMAVPLDGSGTKYTMKLGLGIIGKTGVTRENLPLFEANDSDTIQKQFLSEMYTLESAAGYWNKPSGTYNVIGNCAGEVSGTIENALLTTFILEIQKNNTGYFISYYAEDGTLISQKKFYDPQALNQLDKDFVYAGFFAARNARATFSDIEFTKILAKDDKPAEEKPVTYIEPTLGMSSATVTTNRDYRLALNTNVSGSLQIKVNGQVLGENIPITGMVRYFQDLALEYGETEVRVEFFPDPDQDLGPDTQLSSDASLVLTETITCNRGFYHRKTLYVSPTGLPNGTGDREAPFDIYTAVNNVVPGQTIVLLEGTYRLTASLKIQRGMDGTADSPIRMIADPQAKTRPVLDFQGQVAGIVHGGNYWYFAGFDVTNSAPTQKGFQISGNYNVLDQIHAYRNGNTGIQISRLSGSDLTIADWPSYNLILNCTSYYNSDPGEEDADGFAAKLTCGEGNVFDGCVAYGNADDGWDLYAKVETGLIGAVTIRNCVAYQNGVREDGTLSKGNGNGFKMGGDSLSGRHVLENSIAFFNKAKGIDSNSCPDIIVRNCIAYNNGSYNVAFYTNNAGDTDFEATGILSFRDGNIPEFLEPYTKADNLKPKGSQDESKYLTETNYFWFGESASNAKGAVFTADMLSGFTFKGIARTQDGSIDMQGFLVLTDKAPAGVGGKPGATPSRDMTTLEADLEHSYTGTWYTLDNEFHWQECECGDRGHYGAHELVWITDVEATEATTGKKHQECTVCGHKKPTIDVYYGEGGDQPGQTQPSDPAGSQTGGNAGTEEPKNDWQLMIVFLIGILLAAGALVTGYLLKKKKQ